MTTIMSFDNSFINDFWLHHLLSSPDQMEGQINVFCNDCTKKFIVIVWHTSD